ncbi:MAG: phasin family protein [Pseudomonadota bacterium]
MSTAKAKQTTAAPTATAAADEAAKQIEQAVAAGKETIEGMVKVSQDVASQGYEKAVALTKDQVEAAVKAQNQAVKSYEDAILAAKENLDAMTRSGTILTRGLQDLGKSVLGLTQETIEETVAATKQMMAAKTLRELFDLQANTARSTFDKLMSEGTRLSDLSVKLIEDAFAPINDRVHASVEKLVKSAA